MSAPPLPSNHDLAQLLVTEVIAALAVLPAERRFDVTRIAISYLVIHASHLLAWSPRVMADHLREVMETAEDVAGVRSAPEAAS